MLVLGCVVTIGCGESYFLKNSIITPFSHLFKCWLKLAPLQNHISMFCCFPTHYYHFLFLTSITYWLNIIHIFCSNSATSHPFTHIFHIRFDRIQREMCHKSDDSLNHFTTTDNISLSFCASCISKDCRGDPCYWTSMQVVHCVTQLVCDLGSLCPSEIIFNYCVHLVSLPHMYTFRANVFSFQKNTFSVSAFCKFRFKGQLY